MFYYGCTDEVIFFNPVGVCVASSADGRVWLKPLLNIHPYTANGTLPPVPTNIVFVTVANTFGLHVFYDAQAPGGRVVLAYESHIFLLCSVYDVNIFMIFILLLVPVPFACIEINSSLGRDPRQGSLSSIS